MILLNIPFFESPDDLHCGEASLRSALKYLFPEENFSWKELEKMTHQREGSFPFFIAHALHKKGLKTRYFSSPNTESFKETFERWKREEFTDSRDKQDAESFTPNL
ncbi:MAG: hypothetical protein JW727_05075 [Candidatus Aenigmarchaeota archaeon]|nr:hypothetical protein [Candidatus Aenigmarchaeota archaeon]